MSGANVRPLLPAPRESGSTTTDASAESAAGRRQNSGACDRCRSQKSRCSLCAKRQVHCFYSADVKKQSLEVHKRQGELLHMMRTAPEGEALDILFRLRASGDAQSVLESSRGSMSRQYQPSAIQAAPCRLPTGLFDARVRDVDTPDDAIPRKDPCAAGRIATRDISSRQPRHSRLVTAQFGLNKEQVVGIEG